MNFAAKYRNEVLAPEELRLQIFRQKIKENWEMPLSLADRELLPSQGSAVPRPVVDTGEFQMQEIRRNSQMQTQEKFWIKYETERRIAPGTVGKWRPKPFGQRFGCRVLPCRRRRIPSVF